MDEYYTNAFPINKYFINRIISENCIRCLCKITKLEKKEKIEELLYSISATLGGIYIDDYNPMKNKFSFYIWKGILNKKIKSYGSEWLINKMKNMGFKDPENKTLLNYVKKKYEKDIKFDIIKKEKIEWSNLDWEIKEKIVLGAIKTHPTIRKLIEYKNEKFIDKIGKKILTYFSITITSDENENYFLIVKPKHKIISSETIYNMLKNNKIDFKTLERKLLNGSALITTSRAVGRRKYVKIKKIISPKEKEYWQHTQDINEHYEKEGVPISVGGDDIHCYIFIGEDDYAYHTKNSLLYEGVTEDVQKILLDMGKFLEELETAKSILKQGNLIDFSREFLNISTKDDYTLTLLSTLSDIKVKLKTESGIITGDYQKLREIFDWIFDKSFNPLKPKNCYLPLSIPPILNDKKKIGVYIFYSNISDPELRFIEGIFKKLGLICAINKSVPKIEVKLKKEVDFEDYANSRIIITQTVLSNLEDGEQPFLICISPLLPNNEFDELKMHLFSHPQLIFHQFMYPFNLRKCLEKESFKKPFINSILSQFFHKMGMYLFSLSDELGNYDFIIGYDISREKDDIGKIKGIGGSAIIYNNYGHVKSIITFDDVGSSEIGRYDLLFAQVHSELIPHLNLNNKRKIKILLLKDGRIFKKELEKLSQISKKYNFEITYIDVRKSTLLRFWGVRRGKVVPEYKNSYGKFGRAYYISSHYYNRFFKQPIAIVEKYHIDEGNYKRVEIEENDIKQLVLLTKINYSQLMPDKMRLPAPVHYAHKHVNAVRRGWKIKDVSILRSGCLPTI
ncbi:Piwi domain-containing protein [Methanotorris formicicus]|nr:Piwi domain-containing protein [Methanotorris formicicus]